MSYRLSQIILFIYVGVIAILWYQGYSFFPFLESDKALIAEHKKGISIADVGKLSSLKLDFSLFDDPLYKSLNFRPVRVVELKDIPKGRTNPFSQSK